MPGWMIDEYDIYGASANQSTSFDALKRNYYIILFIESMVKQKRNLKLKTISICEARLRSNTYLN